MAQSSRIPVFKCVLVGDSRIGKTTFLRGLVCGRFIRQYFRTSRIGIYSLVFDTNRGPLQFVIWDTPGMLKISKIADGCCRGSHCAIIMFDVSSRITYKSVPTWHRDLTKLCGRIPVSVCGSKVDTEQDLLKAQSITYHWRKNLQYCNISTKRNYNSRQPFLLLARQLIGDPNLQFSESQICLQPKATMSTALQLDCDLQQVFSEENADEDEDEDGGADQNEDDTIARF